MGRRLNLQCLQLLAGGLALAILWTFILNAGVHAGQVSSPLTVSQVKNAYFQLDMYERVRLRNGSFGSPSSNPPYVKMEKVLLCDLNEDGAGDAAAIIGWNGGGSGYFIRLVAVINKQGKPTEGSMVQMGDRVEVHNLRYEKKKIIVDLMDHGTEDGLAQTTLPRQVEFEYKYGTWIMVKATPPYSSSEAPTVVTVQR